jgi:hypothetical protein
VNRPHRLPPSTLLAASLQPFLAAERTSLQSKLAAVEARNVVLAETVAHQRNEADALVTALERAVHDLERAGRLAQGEGGQDVGGLARETRAIEETLRHSG